MAFALALTETIVEGILRRSRSAVAGIRTVGRYRPARHPRPRQRADAGGARRGDHPHGSDAVRRDVLRSPRQRIPRHDRSSRVHGGPLRVQHRLRPGLLPRLCLGPRRRDRGRPRLVGRAHLRHQHRRVRRDSLDATVASALLIGAVNIGLILIISAIGLAHLDPANLASSGHRWRTGPRCRPCSSSSSASSSSPTSVTPPPAMRPSSSSAKT